MSDSNSSDKRVYSQASNTKQQVADFHTGFSIALNKLRATHMLGRNGTKRTEAKLSALQNLEPLLERMYLCGAVPDGSKTEYDNAKKKIENWKDVTLEDLQFVREKVEDWFKKSHFYDVTIDTENRQIVDVDATMSAAGL